NSVMDCEAFQNDLPQVGNPFQERFVRRSDAGHDRRTSTRMRVQEILDQVVSAPWCELVRVFRQPRGIAGGSDHLKNARWRLSNLDQIRFVEEHQPSVAW